MSSESIGPKLTGVEYAELLACAESLTKKKTYQDYREETADKRADSTMVKVAATSFTATCITAGGIIGGVLGGPAAPATAAIGAAVAGVFANIVCASTLVGQEIYDYNKWKASLPAEALKKFDAMIKEESLRRGDSLLICCISLETATNPVEMRDDPTHTVFDRTQIVQWIEEKPGKVGPHPTTRAPMRVSDLVPSPRGLAARVRLCKAILNEVRSKALNEAEVRGLEIIYKKCEEQLNDIFIKDIVSKAEQVKKGTLNPYTYTELMVEFAEIARGTNYRGAEPSVVPDGAAGVGPLAPHLPLGDGAGASGEPRMIFPRMEP